MQSLDDILEKSSGSLVNLNDIEFKSYPVFKSERLKDYAVLSSGMKDLFQKLHKIGNARDIPVLILGDTGSGKEVMAKYIHYEVDNEKGPFVAVNCPTISKELFESELFGYTKGAFTGADPKGKDGYISQAGEGTLFLDEISEITPEFQSKLLRVIQEREYMPVGSNQTKQLKCRIIGASNQNLRELVEQGRFREDLYYRLTIVPVRLPALSERKDEILPFMRFFIEQDNKKYNKQVQYVEDSVIKLFYYYSWPGNIRELRNLITQIMIFMEGDTVRFEHLKIKEDLEQENTRFHESRYMPKAMSKKAIMVKLLEEPLNLEEFTMEMVEYTLNKFEGNKSKAARYLGLKREQLYNRYNIKKKDS